MNIFKKWLCVLLTFTCFSGILAGCQSPKPDASLWVDIVNLETWEIRESYEFDNQNNKKEFVWEFDDQKYVVNAKVKLPTGEMITNTDANNRVSVTYNYQSSPDKSESPYNTYLPGTYRVTVTIPESHEFVKPYQVFIKIQIKEKVKE